MKALIVKTLSVLITVILTIIMIGSLLAVFISPLWAAVCFAKGCTNFDLGGGCFFFFE